MKVNYFGTLKVCDALFPLLRSNARFFDIKINNNLKLNHSYDSKRKSGKGADQLVID